jgi:beta-hydroxylase
MKTLSIIIVLIIIGLYFSCCEVDRKTGRRIKIKSKDYYKGYYGMQGPMNIFIRTNARFNDDLDPYPDMERNFPNHVKFRNNYQIIMSEAQKIYDNGDASYMKGDPIVKDIANDHTWKKFIFKWYGDISPDARAKCPMTCAILDGLPEVRLAMISILEPGAVIDPHFGLGKSSLRYHLGLSTPNDDRCFISVDGIKYSWRDGEDTLFDDTFEHYVYNSTDTPRFILLCDIDRNLKSSVANAINSKVISLLNFHRPAGF